MLSERPRRSSTKGPWPRCTDPRSRRPTPATSSSRITITPELMTDFLTLGFLQRALAAAALTGGLCSAIGVFVVLRGLAFIGAGTAHAAFAGVALAYLVGMPPMPLAVAFGVGTVL